mgnify:CR=1 FL=1
MKKIGKLLIIILLVIIIIFGKKYIDGKTEAYAEIVRHSLNAFYISEKTDDLKPIITLMDKHIDDRDYINTVQDYASNEVEKWFMNTSGKYLCNRTNLNACPEALAEQKRTNLLLEMLYEYKTKDNNTIITPSTYQSLKRQGVQNQSSIESIIKSPTSKNAENSEEIRLKRCKLATECQCNNNNPTCSCKYTENNITYALVCKNNDYVPKE